MQKAVLDIFGTIALKLFVFKIKKLKYFRMNFFLEVIELQNNQFVNHIPDTQIKFHYFLT